MINLRQRKIAREIEARKMARVKHYFRNPNCDHKLAKHVIGIGVDAFKCDLCGMVGWVSETVVGQVSVGWSRS